MSEIKLTLKTQEEEATKKRSLEDLLGQKLDYSTIQNWFVKWINKEKWQTPFEPFVDINKEEIDIDLFIANMDKDTLEYNQLAMLKKSFDIKRRDVVYQWAVTNNDKATIKALLDETSIIKSQGIKHVVKYDNNDELEKHFFPNGRPVKKTEQQDKPPQNTNTND